MGEVGEVGEVGNVGIASVVVRCLVLRRCRNDKWGTATGEGVGG